MKTIFITGASSGLGKETAGLFQSKGWRVIATMRHPEKETTLNQMENVILLPLDVTDAQQVNDTVQKAIATASIDVVLNNAGYGLIGPLEAFSDEQINRQIATNLSGVIRVTKAFVPHLREKRSGVLINVSSIFGLLGYPTCAIYSATKFAIDGFSECMAYDLAQFGIKVKIVAPGGIQTDFAGRSLDAGQHEAYQQLTAKVSEGYSAEKVANYSKAADIARIIYDAATDGRNQLRYLAGADAIVQYEERLAKGPEAQFEKIREMFTFV